MFFNPPRYLYIFKKQKTLKSVDKLFWYLDVAYPLPFCFPCFTVPIPRGQFSVSWHKEMALQTL